MLPFIKNPSFSPGRIELEEHQALLTDLPFIIYEIMACQSVIRSFQEMGHLQGLSAVLRCQLHSGQRSLEQAIASDAACKKLVDGLILAYSSDHDLGSLARGIKNSCRVQSVLSEHAKRSIESLDAKLQHMVKFRFAPQRFDTVLDVCRLIVLNVRAIVHTLVHLHIAEKGQNQKLATWASKMLAFFNGPQLILLALLAELSSAASKYHHKFDNSSGSTLTRLAKTGFWFQCLSDELDKLFSFKDGEPLVLSESFDAGYLQILTSHYNLLVSESYIDKEKLIFFKPGLRTESNLRTHVAQELGSIRNVVKIYLGLVAAEHQCGVAAALAPFDFSWWQSQFSDERLPGPHDFRAVTFSSRPQSSAACSSCIPAFTQV